MNDDALSSDAVAYAAEDRRFREAVDRFETALLTPQVAGEVAAWADSLLQAWRGLTPLLCRRIDDVHRPQYKEIAREDPENLARVAHLKAEDEAILSCLEKLGVTINELSQCASILPREETPLQDATAGVVECGGKFLLKLKAQEVAVRTWLMEAFNRERGVGD